MVIVVMGITGAGKTAVGHALAERLGLPFHDGDDYHPPGNREKLARDEPLEDEDRWPWLEELSQKIAEWNEEGGAVLACSALKKSYRDVLRSKSSDVLFVLLEAEPQLTEKRLRERAGSHGLVKDFHKILEGQYRDLEIPGHAIRVSNAPPVEEIVDEIERKLTREQDGEA